MVFNTDSLRCPSQQPCLHFTDQKWVCQELSNLCEATQLQAAWLGLEARTSQCSTPCLALYSMPLRTDTAKNPGQDALERYCQDTGLFNPPLTRMSVTRFAASLVQARTAFQFTARATGDKDSSVEFRSAIAHPRLPSAPFGRLYLPTGG